MSINVRRLRAMLAARGTLVRVVVADVRGSAPREAGAEMLVWADGFHGTIGGGALEWRALRIAREVLQTGATRVERIPLGPGLGQCCGGAVTLVFERLDAVPPMPWRREIAGFGLLEEDGTGTSAPLWIWGAGHVGRALVATLAPLRDIVWVDDAAARFPVTMPDEVERLVAADMPRAMVFAPGDVDHLILTYSHEIDLALCHEALNRGFRTCGLIGSATKWARFRSRLLALGHEKQAIDRITCPIGNPALGKHPQAIAVGVAAALLSPELSAETTEGTPA